MQKIFVSCPENELICTELGGSKGDLIVSPHIDIHAPVDIAKRRSR
jgi:hypothetical protein